MDERDTGRDGRLQMRMRLVDRHLRPRERALTIAFIDGRHASKRPEARLKPGTTNDIDGDRLLVRFTYPNDIKGTAFLVWEHPKVDDERFLYLPALGRVRRIAGSERQESFVGSDFTYEDIGGRQFDDYSYYLLDEQATWKSPDGRAHPVYRLESRARDAAARYPRSISLVRKDSFVVVQAEMFNRRNEREKTFDVRKLEQVQGIWTALDIAMANELEHTRTELQVTKAEYNIGLTPSAFSRLELERGG